MARLDWVERGELDFEQGMRSKQVTTAASGEIAASPP